MASGLACMAMGGLVALAATLPFVLATKPKDVTPRIESAGLGMASDPPSIEAGRYLVQVAGCNDCHTPGFSQSGGHVPENAWLTGVPVGFKGPWGTSYPANLRTKVQMLSEDQWTTFARTTDGRPPMPWPALHAMNERDVRSLYRYIDSLGPSDATIPPTLNPGETPKTPYFVFEPVLPK